MAYRTTTAALRERRDRHFARLRELDTDLLSCRRSMPAPLRARLARLRSAAEPADDSAGALSSAEAAVSEYEATLDEALGLSAEMRKWMKPVLPRRRVVARWAGCAATALFVLVGAVHYLGLTGFMWRALGGEIPRARPDLTASELFLLPPLRETAPAVHRPDLDVSLSDTEHAASSGHEVDPAPRAATAP